MALIVALVVRDRLELRILRRLGFIGLVLALVACGADMFTGADGSDVQPASDAAVERTANEDAGSDATNDAATIEASGDASTCTPIQPFTWTCTFSPPYMTSINVPSQYCSSSNAITATPPACRDCKEHYTCACLVAQGINQCSVGFTWHCEDANEHLFTHCDPS